MIVCEKWLLQADISLMVMASLLSECIGNVFIDHHESGYTNTNQYTISKYVTHDLAIHLIIKYINT